MKYFFRICFSLLFFGGITSFSSSVFAQESTINEKENSVLIQVFERKECAHCKAEKTYLDAQKTQRSDLEIEYIDIETEEGRTLFYHFTEKEKITKTTPLTVIGVTILQGFDSEKTTGKRINALVDRYKNEQRIGIEGILSGASSIVDDTQGPVCDSEICITPRAEPLFVTLPLIRTTIDVMQYSLPLLSSILGLIDGFNPCAMWVLVTFLLVLLQIGSRRRMFVFAGLFIIAETVMYYLILNVWFKTWDFVGLDRFVTPLVGMISIGGGLFFLYEWYTADGTCKVVNIEEKAKISGRIKKLASEPLTFLTVLGVIFLAFSVNVIEFACSIGIPQAFTKIIEMNDLSFLQTQGYIVLYIFFYMIDDFLVFGLALWGFDKLHLTAQYSRWSNLIGGFLMLFLGYILLFHPMILRF